MSDVGVLLFQTPDHVTGVAVDSCDRDVLEMFLAPLSDFLGGNSRLFCACLRLQVLYCSSYRASRDRLQFDHPKLLTIFKAS